MKILVLFAFLLSLSSFKVTYAEVPSLNTFEDMNFLLFDQTRRQSYSAVENYKWESGISDYFYSLETIEKRNRDFFKATFYGDSDLTKSLIEKGVDVNLTLKSILGNKTLKDLFYNEDLQDFKPLTGFTPLYIAVIYEHYEIVKLLLEKGANPDGVGKALYLVNCFLRPRDFESEPKIRDLLEKYKGSPSSCETFLPKLTFSFNLEALFHKIGLFEEEIKDPKTIHPGSFYIIE